MSRLSLLMSLEKGEHPESGVCRAGTRHPEADQENKALQGVVFISAKADNFIAGADINMIGHCQNAQEAETLARQGQQLMAEIQALPVPVIAAIHGACLGRP